MSGLLILAAASAVVVQVAYCGCTDGERDDEDSSCNLKTILPGIDEDPHGPRESAIAEALALTCTDSLYASEDLYQEIEAHTLAIFAVDSRMNIWMHNVLAEKPTLSAQFDNYATALPLLDPDSCGSKVTAALGGTVLEMESLLGPQIFVSFPNRMNIDYLLSLYAGLGIQLEHGGLIGDGPGVASRSVQGGRDYLFRLVDGDCPAGCTINHYFWWRVQNNHLTLFGDWGYDGVSGDRFGAMPPDFDSADFLCP